MDCNSTSLSYAETGYFSKIIVDYVGKAEQLSPFYKHPVSYQGIADAMAARDGFATNRTLLVEELQKQYSQVETSALVQKNIEALFSNDTYTICTAHQPVIFTGTLYFIYKILHAVKLAKDCEQQFPGKKFVPVYYMGSEDADLDELGKIYMGTEKIAWDTKQKGAVGRMNTKGLDKIINRLEGEIAVHPHGNELIELFRRSYLKAPDVQTATFIMLNELFKEFGLVILIPDTAGFKKTMIPVFEADLFDQKPSEIVEKTTEKLDKLYKVQANPRAINLFYLKDDIRELILADGKEFEVRNHLIRFTEAELRKELHDHPERFSPNVILRGMFQEQILPNIAFIGGGGETAYWLELRELFEYYKTPFPILVLRNSFLLIEKKWKEKLDKLQLSETDIFQSSETLLNNLVQKNTTQQLSLTEELNAMHAQYLHLKSIAEKVDQSLTRHVEALDTRAAKAIAELEKKLLRSEKRKFTEQRAAIEKTKSALFPLNGLQERIHNFIPWYAKYGQPFFQLIYDHSLGLEQEFQVLVISE